MARQAGRHDTSMCDESCLSPAQAMRRRLLRMMRVAPPLLFLLLRPGPGDAQSQLIVGRPGETLPSFEVVSIRPSNAQRGYMMINGSRDLFRAENVTLKDLIMNAWDIHSNAQIRGESEPVSDEHFNIEARVSSEDVDRIAKLPEKERSHQQALMLQSLLADRFHLKVHIEAKTQPVFALVVAKGGPKFHASAADPAGDAAKAQDSKETAGHHQEGMWTTFNQNRAELTAFGSTLEGWQPRLPFSRRRRAGW